MIVAWMLFATEIGALLFVAAWLAERALLALRRPVRGLWIVAMLAATLLPVAGWLMPRTHAPSVATSANAAQSIVNLFAARALSVSVNSPLKRFDAPLFVLWGMAVAAGMLLCSIAVWRVTRERAGWQPEHLEGTPVLVSHDVGPALVGVLHYSIVVPRWTFALDGGARQLLLTHEREHARRYDPLFLAAAVFLVVLAPWNAFTWFFRKRLHLAVELDCDQRVLKAHPDTQGYGVLLLDVAERVLPSAMPTAAFAEHGSSLETRIRAMTIRQVPLRMVRAAAAGVAAVALVGVACVTPPPYASLPPAERATRLTADLTKVLSSDSLARAVTPAQRTTIAQLVGSAARPVARGAVPSTDASIQVVEPSANIVALERAEDERLRKAVVAINSNMLGNWPRGDSALLLLFNSDGSIAQHVTTPVARLGNVPARNALASTFMIIGAVLDQTSERTISKGLRGETLDTPLHLFIGRLASGAPVPSRYDVVVPSGERMMATLRSAHPEFLTDATGNPLVGALLYGWHGELLGTAAVRMPEARIRSDAERQAALRRAFGAMLDSGVIMQSGSKTFFDDTSRLDGMSRLVVYAVIVKTSELMTASAFRPSGGAGMNWSGSSSRGPERLPDQATTERRLLGLVDTRIPEAFGSWSRADSAVAFIFDADDQLIARASSPIPENGQLLYLANLLSGRVHNLHADDLEAVGNSSFTSSASGRALDGRLTVVWGRLRRGAALAR